NMSTGRTITGSHSTQHGSPVLPARRTVLPCPAQPPGLRLAFVPRRRRQQLLRLLPGHGLALVALAPLLLLRLAVVVVVRPAAALLLFLLLQRELIVPLRVGVARRLTQQRAVRGDRRAQRTWVWRAGPHSALQLREAQVVQCALTQGLVRHRRRALERFRCGIERVGRQH